MNDRTPTTSERIAATIRARIDAGEFAPGDRVPSTRQIVAEHGVAMATASRVLERLRRDGLVEPRRGIGTVVARPGTEVAGRASVRRPAGARQDRNTGPTRDDVVRAAVTIADDDGLAGVSMRRVATVLGVPTMSLYRHVRSREDLVTWMMDAFYAECLLPDPMPGGWRARAEACARTLWAGFERHPWAAHAMSMTRPQLAPHAMAHTEALLAAFDGPFDLNTRMHMAVSVVQLVRGVAAGIEQARAARQDTGISDEEWMDRALPDLRAAMDPVRYPLLTVVTATDLDLTLDSLLEFGLARLLDGYGTFLGR